MVCLSTRCQPVELTGALSLLISESPVRCSFIRFPFLYTPHSLSQFSLSLCVFWFSSKGRSYTKLHRASSSGVKERVGRVGREKG